MILSLAVSLALSTQPNIVIVLADDMGYGDVGCYNPESRIPTPHLDRLAAQGIRFTDAHAPGSVCHPSRYGLLTGRYPFRADLDWRNKACIDEAHTTVPAMLKEQGYRCAMVGKWHLGFQKAGYEEHQVGGPVDRGFDSFFGMRASTDIPPYYYIADRSVVAAPTNQVEANATEGWSPIQGAFWREGGIAPGLRLDAVLPAFTERAVREIHDHHRDRPEQPLFLYVALTAPHTPWLPSPAYQGRGGAGLYGEFTAMVDGLTGEILDSLEKTGMAENTLVLFSSDNGPVWYPDDVERLGHDSLGGLRGMKGDLYEGGHRVPLIIRWPGRVEPGATSDHLICFTDLFATLAEFLGRPLKPTEAGDSFSFLPALLRGSPTGPVRTELVVQSSHRKLLLRQGPWAYIPLLGSGGFTKPTVREPGAGEPAGQLYHLGDDPGETRNLWAQHPRIVERMAARLDAVRDEETRPSDR